MVVFLLPLLNSCGCGSEEAKNWRGTDLHLIQSVEIESGENPTAGSSTINFQVLRALRLVARLCQPLAGLSQLKLIADLLNSRLLLFELHRERINLFLLCVHFLMLF